MKIRYFHIDAFTSRRFAGNPAGVCILEEWLPDSIMQSIAAENKHAETAFIVLNENPLRLRWFTPVLEIDLCGHATLATAYALFNYFNPDSSILSFETRSGTLSVERANDLLVMDFPARPPDPCPTPPLLIQGLGKTPLATGLSRDYFAVFQNEEEVLNIKPDFAALNQLDCLGIIVTAPGKEVDFVSRFFAPHAGIMEDPVTGSSHSTLIPFWAKKLGKSKLNALQLSARGGELWCELVGDRVKIGGRAVTYLHGEIELP